MTEWILCPVCGNKTRTMVREDTELKNFPLYCPKCRKETIIIVSIALCIVPINGEYCSDNRVYCSLKRGADLCILQ